jgi:hypothetical protein
VAAGSFFLKRLVQKEDRLRVGSAATAEGVEAERAIGVAEGLRASSLDEEERVLVLEDEVVTGKVDADGALTVRVAVGTASAGGMVACGRGAVVCTELDTVLGALGGVCAGGALRGDIACGGGAEGAIDVEGVDNVEGDDVDAGDGALDFCFATGLLSDFLGLSVLAVEADWGSLDVSFLSSSEEAFVCTTM